MFEGQEVLVGPQSGGLMMLALEHYVVARREVAPAIEGRIVMTP
jgi:hypothetical protein